MRKPHVPQKRTVGGTSLPQDGHRRMPPAIAGAPPGGGKFAYAGTPGGGPIGGGAIGGGIAPAPDSDFQKIYDLWDKASSAPSVEEADKSMNELIRTFVEGGYVIGVHGEGTVVNVVSNRMHNVQPNLIMDDIFREVGLSRTQQYWLDQE